ncbi:MAG: family 16 glycosylhydrolase [bacterium]|nr:family 16 glycosylhydrolase [bacterium]
MKKQVIILFVLLLLAQVAGVAKDYKGAEYRTKESYIYGRFEARYKPPRGNGIISSFFTYHEITSTNEWNEIDFEILGRYDHDVLVTSIAPGQKWRNSHQYVHFNTHDDFHNYAFEWTPDYIAWFIDGDEVYRQTQEHIAEFRYGQKIMMNLWISNWEPWVGHFDERVLPLFAYYDWISYASYTPGSGNTGTDDNFTFQWKDELDYWDQNRWDKATHTFGGNLVDFTPENIVFNDGVMILCLTKPSPLGYVDQSPPAVLWNRALQNTIQVGFSEPVEPSSAQKISNYLISGLTISEAKLLADQRTVELTVPDLDPQNSYSLIMLGVKDNSPAQNMMVGQNVQLNIAQPLTFPVKINVGGDAYGDYLADQIWSPELEYGHQDGYSYTWPGSIDIIGTEDDAVYLSELQEVVEYKIRVPNGLYKITLMIAENRFFESGKRIFDIFIEGNKVVSDLDLVQEVGTYTACQVVADNVEIKDEMIDIHLTNLWNYSLLNGIIVEQIDTGIDDDRSESIPHQFQLSQNYPNPFNSVTTINYQLPEDCHVMLKVFNAMGQEVITLVNKKQKAGYYSIHWNVRQAASGLYFYWIKANEFSKVCKTILLR